MTTDDGLSIEDELIAAGFGEMPAETLRELAAVIYQELEERVGTELAARCSTEQLDRFEALIGTGDDDAVSAFLSRVLPDYGDVVRCHLDALVALTVQRVRGAALFAHVPPAAPPG